MMYDLGELGTRFGTDPRLRVYSLEALHSVTELVSSHRRVLVVIWWGLGILSSLNPIC